MTEDSSEDKTPAWQRAAKPRAPTPQERIRAARQALREASDRHPGYIASHWHGEQSLARSYWVNNVLLSLPFGLLVGWLMSWISVRGQSLQLSAIATLIAMPLLVTFSVWCIVGAWRSAHHYLRDGGSGLWGRLAQLSLGLGALQLAVSVVFGFVPEVPDYWRMANGIDPIGNSTLTVSSDGRVLQLNGPIGMGDSGRLRDAVAKAPGLKRVELVSPGGRVYEAERMVEVLRQGSVTTRAVGNCESACTLVFLAGKERQLMPGAQLGFHRASTGTYNPVFDELANQHLASTYRNIGLPEYFIDRTLRTPSHSIWHPKSDELVANALIAPLPQTLDVSLPPGSDATAADFADALATSPVWYAIEGRYKGTLAAAAARMQAQRAAGADEDAQQTAALEELARHMPNLLAASSPQLRKQYAQIVRGQLKALLGTAPADARAKTSPGREQCQALLAGKLAPRRQLPVELQVKEALWLVEAAEADPPRWLPKPPTKIELEVSQRTLGGHVPGLLGDLWAGPEARAATAPRCELAIQTLERAAALPVAPRELAERLMFWSPRGS